jgi:hypothetical protein
MIISLGAYNGSVQCADYYQTAQHAVPYVLRCACQDDTAAHLRPTEVASRIVSARSCAQYENKGGARDTHLHCTCGCMNYEYRYVLVLGAWYSHYCPKCLVLVRTTYQFILYTVMRTIGLTDSCPTLMCHMRTRGVRAIIYIWDWTVGSGPEIAGRAF